MRNVKHWVFKPDTACMILSTAWAGNQHCIQSLTTNLSVKKFNFMLLKEKTQTFDCISITKFTTPPKPLFISAWIFCLSFFKTVTKIRYELNSYWNWYLCKISAVCLRACYINNYTVSHFVNSSVKISSS